MSANTDKMTENDAGINKNLDCCNTFSFYIYIYILYIYIYI